MVTLEMAATQETGVLYNVSIIPQVDVEFVDSTVVLLRVAYNVVYNVSIVSILCGQHAATTKLELNYGEPCAGCTVVRSLLRSIIRVQIYYNVTLLCE